MGWHLSRLFGRGYVNIGFLFNEGCFRSEINNLDREFAVGPAPEGTLESAFRLAGLGLAFLDLRAVEPDSPLGRWMAFGPPTRCIGYGYSFEDEMNQYTILDPRVLYDALIYFPSSSSPRMLN